jgi:hypothetical protein
MASGHEYRANRPNTWLLRPMLLSEDSSCQPGAVHTWPLADPDRSRCNVCFRGSSRHGAENALMSVSDQCGAYFFDGRNSWGITREPFFSQVESHGDGQDQGLRGR